MKPAHLHPSDPISACSIHPSAKTGDDGNSVKEGLALWLLQNFRKCPAKVSHSHRAVPLREEDPREDRNLKPNYQVDGYSLRTHSTDHLIADA